MFIVNRESLIEITKTLELDSDINVEDFRDDIPLEEQGLDSLDMMNLYFQLEEKFGVEISEESLTQGAWKTIDDILQRLRQAD